MRAIVVTVVVLLFTACADVCERGAAINKSFSERHAACYAESTLPGAPFDTAKCDDSMNACSTQDETALHTWFDCVERLPTCTPATRAAFNEKSLACANGMGQLTDGCFRP
ncbi:MAG: hypothetical protein Q8L48_05855 [Archangium sp.]|nr:hypothetical protein [Archangium sp.]